MQDVILFAYKHPVRGKTLSEKTLKNLRNCLTAFIKYARKAPITKLYPESLYIPRGAEKSHKGTLQPEDIVKLFSCDTTVRYGKEIDEWYIHLCRLIVIVGLRPGEAFALKNSNIENHVCCVRGSINVYNEHTTGKNENAIREFVLPQKAEDVLFDQKNMLKRAGVISPYVFPNRNGQATNLSTFEKRWTIYRDHNGISKRTPYELRHTFFSVNKSLPKELIKNMGGHSDDFDTFGTYGHELTGEAEKTAVLVNNSITKILKGVKTGVKPKNRT